MRGHTICNVWARIPGLNDYWCYQIQWRIGIDEEVIAALTEPRYPVPATGSDRNHPSLETIILVQTIYLCQLFLHLQEFDPGVGPEQRDGEEELIRVFQDSLAREFNNVPPLAPDDGPAPDGETLERVVRGLMKAQRDEQSPALGADPTATSIGDNGSATPELGSAASRLQLQLQQLLVRILAELNRPLFDKARRYEQAFGARTDETWAARFATRVMQWRWSMRPPSPALAEDIIRVFPHDVHPLDEEGLQVYRIVRNAAPGHIHLVTPLQPDLQPDLQPLMARVEERSRYAHQRSGSSGFRMQQPSPVAQHSPRTPKVQQAVQTEGTIKRGSPRDAYVPPLKRPRSMVASDELTITNTDRPVAEDIPIRSVPTGIETERREPNTGAESTTNNLLWRVLDGITNLGKQIDGMHQDLGQRFNQLDDRLKHIEEWISDEV